MNKPTNELWNNIYSELATAVSLSRILYKVDGKYDESFDGSVELPLVIKDKLSLSKRNLRSLCIDLELLISCRLGFLPQHD